MNKVVAGAVAGLAIGAFSLVSALDMSWGSGLSFVSNFGGGFKTPEIQSNGFTIKELENTTPWMGGTLGGFFDLTYAEISLGFTGGTGTLSQEVPLQNQMGQIVYVKQKQDYNFVAIDIGLLGKYPVALSDAVTLAPLVGIDYQLWLGGGIAVANIDGSVNEEPGDNSRLWIKFGAGLDYNLNERLFLRIPVLYGIGLANKVENDVNDTLKQLRDLGLDIGDAKILLSHGLTIGFNVGFKL